MLSVLRTARSQNHPRPVPDSFRTARLRGRFAVPAPPAALFRKPLVLASDIDVSDQLCLAINAR